MSEDQKPLGADATAVETARQVASNQLTHAAPTPGPWSVAHFADDEVDCDCAYVLSEAHFGSVAKVSVNNGKPIADGGNDCPGLEEAKANAHLLAAAPEMYEALQAAINGPFSCPSVMVDQMRAALKKAEGRS